MTRVGAGIAAAVSALALLLLVPSQPCCPKVSCNETAAIATLRNLTGAQSYFQDKRFCDLDGDGVGEFGTLGEMTARNRLRADPAGAEHGARIGTALLAPSLSLLNGGGVVLKSGYFFRVFLPGENGGAVHEEKDGPFSGPVDINACEKRWCAYAWPVAHGNSGIRTFFVDQGGDVWWTRPTGRPYQGLNAPAWDAAMPAEGKPGWSPATDPVPHVGRDGNEWRPAK